MGIRDPGRSKVATCILNNALSRINRTFLRKDFSDLARSPLTAASLSSAEMRHSRIGGWSYLNQLKSPLRRPIWARIYPYKSVKLSDAESAIS
ncbi:hypothetical protein LshimejAT787_0407940 [Lyophyllum shimeji]|uniref:Uncharacterized protein n=1 Tax=Lyophyllum shimeji TaxID=47721 RepID=A0A9P3PLQ4_LYOSH|nr:hypothetical protein LshimejAT787_0407940 [Lyophyllum shimeji]